MIILFLCRTSEDLSPNTSIDLFFNLYLETLNLWVGELQLAVQYLYNSGMLDLYQKPRE
jgi:hypothetical protein